MPFTATMSPATSLLTASAIASAPPATRGPQSAQAFVSEWKRRSIGFSYSSLQSAHIVKAAIVVRERSQGSARTIV